MESDSWTDGILTWMHVAASGWSPYLCLVQTGMSRDNRISWMGMKVGRYKEHMEKQPQRVQAMGRWGLLYPSLRVSVDTKQLQSGRRQEGGGRQRFRKAVGEGGNSQFWLMGLG